MLRSPRYRALHRAIHRAIHRALLSSVAALASATLLGCPSPSAERDAASPTDATAPMDAIAPIDAAAPSDAPRRRDAFAYDSGASCERSPDDDAGVVTRCNGHEALCDRRLDEVAFATTHNAMSSEDEGFIGPNQHHALWRQLGDGVRGFMLDAWSEADGSVSLCHGSCAFGRRPLVDGLRDLRLFLDCHPHDVAVIIFEAHAPHEAVAEAFEESGLARYLHTPSGAPSAGYAWPTLRELIGRGERLVVFTDDTAADEPWHLHTYDWAWENPYAAASPEELSCAEDRGSRDRSLWVFNHFLTSPIARPDLAEQINHDPLFTERVERCRAEASGDLPNFVTVDFYDIGDVLSVVDALNGVGP